MNPSIVRAIALLVICLASLPLRAAEPIPHALFTRGAVLQQELPVPVWGTGDAGTSVTVEFAGQKKTTQVKADGTWLVVLDAMPASAEPRDLVITGAQSRAIPEILVGEVWVCSGQSNMAMLVTSSKDAAMVAEEAAAGKYRHIRLFRVPVAGADAPQSELKVAWMPADAKNSAAFTATGFYFGRALHAARNVPIGLIQSANGGTNAYSWIDSETFKNDPAAGPARTMYEGLVARFPKAQELYEKQLAEFKEKAAAAKAANQPFTERAPREPLGGPEHPKRPAGHYNAMIAPLQPFAMRGAIWYQGEANARTPYAEQYKDLMLALIEDWRGNWQTKAGLERRDFPFLVVQLPNFANGDPWGWPVIREQMFKIWKEGKNTGVVSTLDVGEPTDIHPKDKRPIGERLATFARGSVYGEKIEYSGPVYASAMFGNGEAVITFDHVGSGLVSKDGAPLKYFEVAGANGAFFEGTATISGNTVTVKSPEVKEPAMVRYAWLNNPEGANLANKEGLLAFPFRTDTGVLAPPVPARP